MREKDGEGLEGDKEEERGDAAVAVCCVVVLWTALAPSSLRCVSFAAWAAADERMLQKSSRKSVHLRSGAPIVGIAWSHSLSKPCLLQVGLPGVEYRYHGAASG